MYKLAVLYDCNCDYDLAIPLYEETLAGWKTELGLKHKHTLMCMQRLGIVYRTKNSFEKVK